MKESFKSTACACGNAKHENDLGCPDCLEEIYRKINRFKTPDGNIGMALGDININNYFAAWREQGIAPAGTCCFCDSHYVGGGYDPYPVIDDEESRCCTQCNYEVVLPARFSLIAKQIIDEQNKEKSKK